MNQNSLLYPLSVALLLGSAPLDALARIKLTTLPVRERRRQLLDALVAWAQGRTLPRASRWTRELLKR